MEASSDQPSLWRLPGTLLAMEIHQDDAYAGGTPQLLEWFRDRAKSHMCLKSSPIMGPGNTYAYLKATRTYLPDGRIHIGAREAHTDNILKELGLVECNPVPTPIVRTRRKEDLDTELLAPVDKTSYNRCVGIARHLVRYRPDTAEAIHELSKSLSTPRQADMDRLRRFARYLQGTRGLGVMVARGDDLQYLDAYTDVDWSGGQVTMKSTTGCGLVLGSTLLKEKSVGQNIQSLSSCEREFYAADSTGAEAIHMQKLLGFLGFDVQMRLRIDSTAAKVVIEKQGCSGLKHIETRMLWLQAKHAQKKLVLLKEPTETQLADGFTKALQPAKFLLWRSRLGLGLPDGSGPGLNAKGTVRVSPGWSVKAVAPLKLLTAAVVLAQVKAASFWCPEPVHSCGAFHVGPAAIVLAVLVISTMWKAMSWTAGMTGSTRRVDVGTQTEQKNRSIATQSQTTYHSSWKTPRATVLGAAMHGAWEETRPV